ncbi:MAG TPA: trypsin-like peptidase domain-containing protein [Gemmataceae bacterium]|nr:trypsin-like peptidase domain-containing protein [Gemmataceae bacterium]
MSRLTATLVLTAAFAGAGRADLPPEVIALQKSVHRVNDAAKPSIACVLVSRSDKYAGLGQGPKSAPGELGEFNLAPGARWGRGGPRDLWKRLDLANPETVPEAYGSGVVIDDSGLILTNYHVIRDATKVFVRLPGDDRGSYANIVAGDSRCDLAVLRMIRPPADLKAIPLGDGGKARQGDFVVCLANPFAAGFKGGMPSFSGGLISNLRRRASAPGDEATRVKDLAQYGSLIETDVRLNVGCSGGALLNLDGELIGLTSAIAAVTGSDQPGGFAIPIDANAKKMIDVLKKGQEVEYGFLGVTVNPDARGDGRGVTITDVAPGMPAQRAGLIGGDTVVAINGNPVRDQDDLFLHIAAALAGSEVEVRVERRGDARTFKARLAKSNRSDYPFVASNPPRAVHGLRVDYISTMPIGFAAPEGVLVKDLEANSAAERALKKDVDRGARLIVVAVDGKVVESPPDFYRLAAGKGSVTLDVVELAPGSARRKVTLP